MLVTFTDANNNNVISVNPEFVVAVFEVAEGEKKGTTVINVINGNVLVKESYIETVGRLNVIV